MLKRGHATIPAMAVSLALALALSGCAGAPPQGGEAGVGAPGKAQEPAAKTPAPAGPEKAAPGYRYFCGCGPTCSCDTHADKKGNCACDKPLVYKKILREDSSYYWVCSCAGCGCDSISKDDPLKCGCGKPLQAVVKKGKFACACGPGCDCNAQSQQMGNCSCGKPMKPVQ